MGHIAIIGIGCRFPGADGAEAFWRVLREGVDCVTEIPSDRWAIDKYYDPNPAAFGKMNTRSGGFVKDIDLFDPQFFKISPREASYMDPQQRLLLEVVWGALEDGGQVAAKLAGSRTGVFVGMGTWDYHSIQMRDATPTTSYSITGISQSIAANRISYVFDFNGPSMAIDTACSASLVAVHIACQSLNNGDCTLALAGGVNVILDPSGTVGMTKLGALSSDGRCKAFDARANGYVRSEGAGIVLLKPLAQALKDRDPIYAVIRGSAVNQGGRSNGITAPNPRAQESLLREAYKRAEVSPGLVQYVEAHGTGTLLGDPIEMKSLGAVMSAGRPAAHPCLIGTVKTNIGHLESAAGIAGLIKVALALKHREIPANLHFIEPNPNIPFDELPLKVQQRLGPWPDWSSPAVAGVNSFGFGGSNAHVVVEEAPQLQCVQPQAEHAAENHSWLLPISAHSQQSLRALTGAYRDMLISDESSETLSLHDMCYTAGVRRTHHDYRLALAFSSRKELIKLLDDRLQNDADLSVPIHQSLSRRQKLVFVFGGQGGHWLGMGRELLAGEKVFAETIQRCDEAMRPYLNWSLLTELQAAETASQLDEVRVVQPCLFAIEVALAELWRSYGIKPDAVVGHSLGEIAAAYIAGVLTLEDAARIVCSRSKLMHQTSGQGAMLSVELSLVQAQKALEGYEDQLCIAVTNSPKNTVIAGDPSVIRKFMERLQAENIVCRLLNVRVAYHSPQVDPLLTEFTESVEDLSPRPPAIPMYSTVTNTREREVKLDAQYWARNMREPVLFSGAIEQLIKDGYHTFLDISPHPNQLYSIQQILDHVGQRGTVLPSMRRRESGRAVFLKSLGVLYALGQQVNWDALYPSGGQCVRLPSYPWQRERYWIETPEIAEPEATAKELTGPRGASEHPLLGRRIMIANAQGTRTWEVKIGFRFLPYLSDHRLQETAVMPGAAFAEMALAAGKEAFGDGQLSVTDLAFHKALFLPDNGSQPVQLVFSRDRRNEANFSIYSQRTKLADSWTLHSSGRIQYSPSPVADISRQEQLLEVQLRCNVEVATKEFYLALRESGLQYGVSFQGIEKLWRSHNEALGQLSLPQTLHGEIDSYQLHPALLDSCIQVLLAARPDDSSDDADGLYIPTRIREVRFYKRPTSRLWSHARLRAADQTPTDMIVGDISLLDEDGRLAVEIEGIECQRLDTGVSQNTPANIDESLYQIEWQPLSRVEQQPEEIPLRTTPGRWLIFADKRGVGLELSSLLDARGENCFIVSPGETYQQIGDNQFYINPARPEDMALLVRAVVSSGHALRGVVHLWSLDAVAIEEITPDTLDVTQISLVGSVLELVRQIASNSWNEVPRLWLITKGSQAVDTDNAALSITQSVLWGFGRTIALEHPEFWGGLVDLDQSSDILEDSSLLINEVHRPDGENQIAVRKSQRFVARLLPKEFSNVVTQPLKWRSDASYLITGGMGDLGLEVARWMAKQGARRIILMGRSELPPRAQWRAVAREESPLSHRIRAIQEIERLGASVKPVFVDVADESQLTCFLDEFYQEGWPPIRGVVHAAGVLRDRTLLQLDARAVAEVWKPKVNGSWLLHRLLEKQDNELDFFVFFSSAASLLGSAGQANYAAANSFLDALAHHRLSQGKPALSINWGHWAKIGLAARSASGDRLSYHGVGSIQPERGMEVLGHLLEQELAQAGVLPINWKQWCEFNPPSCQPLVAHLISNQSGPSGVAEFARGRSGLTRDTLLSVMAHERSALLETYLCERLSELLMLPTSKFDAQQSLDMLGIDSLMALQLTNRVEIELGVAIPLITLLRGPTIAELSELVLNQMQSEASLASPGVAEKSLVEIITRQAEQVDDEEMDRLLAELEQLSDHEAQLLLNTQEPV